MRALPLRNSARDLTGTSSAKTFFIKTNNIINKFTCQTQFLARHKPERLIRRSSARSEGGSEWFMAGQIGLELLIIGPETTGTKLSNIALAIILIIMARVFAGLNPDTLPLPFEDKGED